MRSAVRDVKIPVTITICSGILAAVALLSMYLNVAQVRVSAQIQSRSFLDLYVFVAVIGFLMLVFLMPALTAGSISGERERQTLDIMMTTMVSRWDIVSGKLLASLCRFSGLGEQTELSEVLCCQPEAGIQLLISH